jgi:hypothetical protein
MQALPQYPQQGAPQPERLALPQYPQQGAPPVQNGNQAGGSSQQDVRTHSSGGAGAAQPQRD